MSTTTHVPEFDRLAFFPGQRLTAEDLSALQDAQRELRWLHARSLHDWGIGTGLAVAGERGATAVVVEPGYAVDCVGREIILSEPRTLPVPAVASAPGGGEAVYYLVAAYLSDSEQAARTMRPGVCTPGGTVRLADEPSIEWRTPNLLREGLDIVLAQAWILNCRLSRPLSPDPRRSARPAHQPYIAAGQTVARETGWDNLYDPAGTIIGVKVTVPTQSARFRTTPRYIAHVAGERHLPPGDWDVLVTGNAAIVSASPEAFLLQVHTTIEGNAVIDLLDTVITTLKWYVIWMGIEG